MKPLVPAVRPCLLSAITAISLLAAVPSAGAGNWPAWRGPTGDGICTENNLPMKWSATENVKWRIPLPERGNSTPVVWGEKVFVTQAVQERRTLMCLNRADGKLAWQVGVATNEKEPTHSTNPYCPASPATDGERVIVSFASDGLFCYDFAGKELWKRTDLGRQFHIWGNGASPVIRGNLCFLNFGPADATYLIAVDKRTGKTVWKQDESTGYKHPKPGEKGVQGETYIGSWTTPIVTTVEGKEQLLMSWPKRLVAYDLQTGSEIWHCTGLNPLCYTSPIHADGIVVAMGGFGGSAFAVRAGGGGDVTGSRRLWHHPRSPQRIGSGVIHDGRIYIHNDPGTAMCLDLKTGATVWSETLTGKAPSKQNWSSVMLAGGHCYSITQGGDCFVFKASPQFELVSVNSLGEPSNSSIAPSNGELFIRTHRSLWCIAEKR
ncbi:MAG: serine/threonine protein kinase [Verrucomicrobia bacterium]|nr:serine/threonine protein kinase [Verrucomicrobiota bacterium]